MEDKNSILIVDDVIENIKILIELLKDKYTTYFAKNGKSAIEMALSKKPDLILLDVIMPEINGYSVCKQLKEDERTKDIPIIFVSALHEIGDEANGLSMGAVDYITKPFSPPIVLARVNTHIRLSTAISELKRLYSIALDSNPLTGLPGNNTIMKRVQTALDNKESVCVLYCDLDNFKAYNDRYGFAMGDKILLFTASVLSISTSVLGLKDVFIGHIGGDDFIAIIPSDVYKSFAEEVIKHLDFGITQFYSKEDVEAGRIVSVNRRGEKEEFPLVTVSIACVDLNENVYKDYLEITDACSLVKKKSKSVAGSCYFVDQRKKRNIAGQESIT